MVVLGAPPAGVPAAPGPAGAAPAAHPAQPRLPRPRLGVGPGPPPRPPPPGHRGQPGVRPHGLAVGGGHRAQCLHHEVATKLFGYLACSCDVTVAILPCYRGRSAAGDGGDSYIRIIVWAREAVRGAKVTSAC